ncbi:hypothetical protein A5819_000066 [Enterococcus sp. 7E2_DIV0204]|uniref:hypothetical protein n=1 Tax=unclassified Enterococcus TaxID=2608891 RepID=UPI000A346F67|nr:MULTISPECIES: hypothetical protein [unclassified Enterococcus]OTN87620.1 hypothetical protein A5819_000066 [Enterococcus sp. 7E2_DIV0204]OTP49700.1 hypothetical protein A5884_002900 [Enterococcus sp. 7D2_DIV0200]
MKLRIFCLIVGMFTLVGCGKEDTATKISKESSSESSLIENSTQETSNSTEEDMFGLMIEAARSQIPAAKEQFGDMYKDMTITEGKDHTIVYTYTFSQKPIVPIDTEALKPTLVKGMKPVINSAKGMFSDVKIQAIYLNPDGTEIGNIIITQDDINALEDATEVTQ